MHNKIHYVSELPVASIWCSDQSKRVSACLFENELVITRTNELVITPNKRFYSIKTGRINLIAP